MPDRTAGGLVGGPRAAAWLALAALGQAAALRLIQAGPTVSYQHYRLILRDPVDVAAAAVLLVQVSAVMFAWSRHAGELGRWIRATLTPTGTLVLVIAVFATSATVSREPGRYLAELIIAGTAQLAALGSVILFARALPDGPVAAAGARLGRWLDGDDPDVTARPRFFEPFAVILAVAVTAVAILLAVVSYQRHPHVPDEVVYLLHAKYFARGLTALPAPPVPEAFSLDIMHLQPGRWFSPVPPGWPAALALGAFLGVPWLVNPVLGGLNVLLAHAVLSDVYPRRVARLTTLLLACSPWFVFMSMNFMTHQFTLACALAGALGVSRARQSGRPRVAALVAAGGAIGVVSLIRPLEGLAVAGLLGLWSLPLRGRRWRFAPTAALATGAAAVGALVFPYNARMTGSAKVFPIMLYTDTYYAKGSNDLGFGANRGLGWPGLDPFPGHGLRDVVVNTNLNITAINTELFGWATGSMIALLFLLARRRLRRADWWMLAVIVMIAGIHGFYWFAGGPDFGARYWYLLIVPAVALSARGVDELSRSLTGAERAPPLAHAGETTRAYLGVLTLSALALTLFVPWRAADKYYRYRGMRPDVRRMASELHFGRSLVLVRGLRHPDYASAAVYNPLDLQASAPVYAWDVSPEVRRQVLAAYTDRPVWIIEGPTITHDGYGVAAGPLTAEEAMRRSDETRSR